MFSPKLVPSAAVACLLLGLTGCMGFSSNQKSSQAAPSPDFSVNINPGSTTIAKGGKANVNASIAAEGSFAGLVQLALTGAPAGVTATLSSKSVNNSGSPTVSISVAKTTAPGTYKLTLWAASGSLSHSADLSLVVSNTVAVPDFSLTASPATQSIAVGQSTSFNLNVEALNEFTGAVSLTASGLPTGMLASFTPGSIDTSGSAVLNISTSSSVAPGTYALTIAGTSGTISHSTTVSVTLTQVTPPDFSISATPGSQTVTAGGSTSFVVTVAGSNKFTGSVSLAESGMPAGMLVSCTPASITSSGSCSLSVSTTSSTVAGTYPLTITGTSGSLSHSTSFTVVVKAVTLSPDFTISARPASQSITAGNATSFTVTIAPVNGFTGSVALNATGLPSGVAGSFVPATVTASGNATLNLTSSSSTASGNYPLTISGTSGGLSHNTNLSLTVSKAADQVKLNVMQFPGARGDPWFKDVSKYLFNNSAVNGATIAIEWSGSDQGPSAGANQYDWTYPDQQIQPWIQAGKKVNLVVWAIADNSTMSCGPDAQYGSDNTGNCSVPSYVWTAIGSSNATVCDSQYGTQQLPNYFASGFQNNYKKFIAAVIQRYQDNPGIGYIRFGLGHGGETIPVMKWYDTSTPCGRAFVNTWGYTVQTWESYLSSMLNYEGSLNSHVQLMVGITPLGVYNSRLPDYVASVAVQNNIGFGSQGLQQIDVNNCSGSSANWCELFDQYAGQVPLELQTVGQSCPAGGCDTGSLVDSIPFAVANNATVFEIYYEDWLVAYDPNYPGYYPAYQPVFQAAASK